MNPAAARAACRGAAVALAALLVAGVVIALATPDSGFLGVTGRGAGIVPEALRDAVGATGARYGQLAVLPLLFVAVPIAACTLGARVVARAAPPGEQLRWALGMAIPFAAGLVVIALLSKGRFAVGGPVVRSALPAGTEVTARPSVDSVIVHAAVWSAAGALLAVRPALPWPVLAVAKPLAAVLAFLALSGVAFSEVSTVNADGFSRLGRPEGVAIAENALFAGEHAVDFAGLGALAYFANPPAPLSDTQAIRARPHVLDALGRLSIHLPDYRHAYPGWLFALLVLTVVAVPLAVAAWTGAALAQATGAWAWGATVGPAWAIALWALRLLAYDRGALPAGELFLGVLVGGIGAGALGGLIARRSSLRAA